MYIVSSVRYVVSVLINQYFTSLYNFSSLLSTYCLFQFGSLENERYTYNIPCSCQGKAQCKSFWTTQLYWIFIIIILHYEFTSRLLSLFMTKVRSYAMWRKLSCRLSLLKHLSFFVIHLHPERELCICLLD